MLPPWGFMVGYLFVHYELFGAIRYAIAPCGPDGIVFIFGTPYLD